MQKLPVIGLTLDAEEPGGYSKFPWYALRRNYFDSLREAGGLPIALPHDARAAADYLALCDGILVTGGAFDVDPALYGDSTRHETVSLKPARTDFELAITRAALAAGKPVLGICGGEQLLAVAFGGTLIQHIPDSIPAALPHEQPNPRDQPGHSIAITPGTLLAGIVGTAEMAVNSAHHQAVATPGPGAVVNAMAPDGVIEGIEHTRHRFALGVQWHPEFKVDSRDIAILRAFVDAARG